MDYILAIVFYILFFGWILFKIRNIILVRNLNCKDFYKDLKKEAKKQKLSKSLFKISITTLIIFCIYLAIGLISGAFALFMGFITIGGAAYVGTGTSSSLYDNLTLFLNNYWWLFNYIGGYTFYIITYTFFTRNIYIDILNYNSLKQLQNQDTEN